MTRYIIRRLIQAIPNFFGITILVFIIMSLVPGGFVELLYFGDPDVTPEDKERLEDALGLNDPLPLQYLRWLIGDDWQVVERRAPFARESFPWLQLLNDGVIQRAYDGAVDEIHGNAKGILRGDFGRSFKTNRDALKLVVDLLPATLELGVASLLFGLVTGIPVGIIAAIYKNGWFDNSSRVLAVFLNSIPNFWLGLIFLYVFAFSLGLLPTGDRYDIGERAEAILQAGGDSSHIPIPPIWTRLEYLLLPVIVLGAAGLAGNSRLMRSTMLDTIHQDYIRTARAKGLPLRVIWFKHGVRNALIPIAVGLGPGIAFIWGGAPVTEAVFTWPGIGRLSIIALGQRDFPIVLTVMVLSAIATIVGFLLSDIFVAMLDPRVRFD
ncbi:MAG: ABC transporter permease [Anaerolineaceae bacterium]|nr:ABC transporter permease [Anaerolineaceae bacterium]